MIQIAIRRSKGWWTCDATCQEHKHEYNIALKEYNYQKIEEAKIIASAKSSVGIFSNYGVDETRLLFWTRFGQGKKFAQKQTKW